MPRAGCVSPTRAALRAALVPAACAALLARVSADVIVVDEAGAGDFPDVQPAVDAAADGYGTDDDDLRLDAASPCIDAGSNSRAVGVAAIVDIGAHERRPR